MIAYLPKKPVRLWRKPRKSHAIMYGGVYMRVVQEDVSRLWNGGKESHVGVEARVEEQCHLEKWG